MYGDNEPQRRFDALSRLPEHPTPAMIERGIQIHQTPRTGSPETLVHDIWQAMYDEWQSEAIPPAASDQKSFRIAPECLSALASGNPCQPDDTLNRCTICGFVVDTQYAVEKPTTHLRPTKGGGCV